MTTPTKLLKQRLKEIKSCIGLCVQSQNKTDLAKLRKLEKEYLTAINSITKANRLKNDKEMEQMSTGKKKVRGKAKIKPLQEELIEKRKATRSAPIVLKNGKEIKRITEKDYKII